MTFSVIVPVYNRPDEVRELLESLAKQTFTDFEVLIVEDGSSEPCEDVAREFQDRLNLRYFYKENSGQGFSRNYGFDRARGDWYVVFDSDCLVPPDYFRIVRNHLDQQPLDAWGGPDRAHDDFTPLQKAISYSMTSPLTTGGIRGNARHAGTFHPRSFNMGISAEVYRATGGYRITRMGEDIEFSLRIIKQGFRTGLIPDAWVYHKRRTSLGDFFRQAHFFGRARINIARFHPGEIKWVHALPALFTVGLACYLLLIPLNPPLFGWLSMPFGLFLATLLMHAGVITGSLRVGALAVFTSLVQLTGYGSGFIREQFRNRTG
ncbi:MAG: glycosyltransferase [Balneolaceae bacterium]|nr:glycosyltransferase [Balneolaceae bacterium]